MGEKVGADVVALRGAAKVMLARAQGLERCTTDLDRLVRTDGVWVGADADSFESAWFRITRSQIGAVVASVREAGTTMLRNAAVQEAVSNERHSGALVPSGHGAPGTGTPGKGTSSGPAPEPGGTAPEANADASVPRYPERGQPDLTDTQLQALRGKLHEATENRGAGDFFGGNAEDIDALREDLSTLSPEQLDQFLRTCSDDQLRQLGQTVQGPNGGLFRGGIDGFARQALLDQMLAKASPEQAARLQTLIPWSQPNGEAMGDGARGQSGDSRNTWMTPTVPVIAEDHAQSANDIRQGGYGTCVVDSAAGALVTSDPNWARDHVTDNGNGTVSIKLYQDGHERWVTVSKDLPDDGQGHQKGAQPGPGGNWPAYVEKALAQVYAEDNSADGKNDTTHPPGSYRAIEGNYGPDVLKYLTPQETSKDKDAGHLWEAAREGRPAIVSTEGEKPDGAPAGYVAGHEYFVTGMQGDKIVLQNPWGPHEKSLVVTEDDFEKFFQNATVVKK